jgi:hypothetical protein
MTHSPNGSFHNFHVFRIKFFRSAAKVETRELHIISDII